MAEFLPITAGLVSGLLLGSFSSRSRLAAGFLATVVSGEWRVSWAFLLVDIPLVAGCAVIGFLTSRALVLRRSTGQWSL